MTDVETQLPARLHVLADDLTGDATVSTEAVLTTYRRRRRTRAGLLATTAAVVAVAVAVPTVGSALGSAPTNPAAPAPLTTDAAPTTSAAAPTPDDEADAEGSASIEERAAELSAELAAAAAAVQAEMEAVHARLPSSLALTAPAEWGQWLPEGKPIQGTTPEEDMRTCPRIAAHLGADLGQEFSYWTGTLPQGPIGCTWVPTPLKSGPEAPDYPYVLSIGFLGDGTTVESLARSSYLDGLPDGHPVPCPRIPLSGGGLLLRCDGSSASEDHQWTLLLPDARGAGLWILTAGGRTDAAHPSSDAFLALVQAAAGVYG